jgi:SAM-dependent methyltransferase
VGGKAGFETTNLQVLHDAAGGVRTHDLRIKSPLLYQLSYSGGPLHDRALELIAVEPEPSLRSQAAKAAADAPVPVRVVPGVADELALAEGSADAVVVCGVLCSVPDQAGALAEFRRVLRPGGELRFYEHVRSRRPGFARADEHAGQPADRHARQPAD